MRENVSFVVFANEFELLPHNTTFFFIKCRCAVSGPCARIELYLYLCVRSIGSMVVVAVARIQVQAIMKVVQVVIPVVVVAVAPINVQATMKAVQVIMIPVADASVVSMVQYSVPVHLGRCSFHLQILLHSKH